MVSIVLHIPVEVTLTCTVEFMVVGTGEKERNVCCSVNTACVCGGRYRREREKLVLVYKYCLSVNTACVCCGRYRREREKRVLFCKYCCVCCGRS